MDFKYSSNFRGLQHKITHTQIIRQGIPYCADFLNGVLDTVTRGSPEAIAQGIQVDVPTPLYVQWQRLQTTIEACQTVLALKCAKEASRSSSATTNWAISGATRELMTMRLKQARLREKRFERIIGRELGSSTGFLNALSALIEVDRRIHRGRTLNTETQQNNVRKTVVPHLSNSSQGPRSATLQVRSDSSYEITTAMNGASHELSDKTCSPEQSFVGAIGGSYENQRDLDDDDVAECICCFEQAAVVVFTKCGHLTYCKTCRRKAVKLRLGSEWTNIRSYSRALRSTLRCPICRQDGSTTELAKFTGAVYK